MQGFSRQRRLDKIINKLIGSVKQDILLSLLESSLEIVTKKRGSESLKTSRGRKII